MPTYAFLILAIGWLVWATPFFLMKRGGGPAQTVDRRARWGILLQVVAYSAIWQTRFWEKSPAGWRTALSFLFLGVAGVLSWTSTRALGRHWRIDAGLDADHQLVRSGAYRFVRHPIYTSMLSLLLGTGLLVSPLWLMVVATLLFLAGTEIRARIEDRLLAARFGDAFHDYRRSVPAYIPFFLTSGAPQARDG